MHLIIGFTKYNELHLNPLIPGCPYYSGRNQVDGLFVLALLTRDASIKIEHVMQSLVDRCEQTSFAIEETYATNTVEAIKALYYAVEVCTHDFLHDFHEIDTNLAVRVSLWASGQYFWHLLPVPDG